MKITQKFFNNFLNKNYLFENSPRVVVGVSGGPDSMCLVYLLNKWIKINKGSLIALIIDHGLRLESASEAKKIKKYLLNFNIKSKIITINKKEIIKKNMNEARKNRFSKLFEYCIKKNSLHLFLGHHFDDNLETYLLRKLAGSNFEGLRSIKYKSSFMNLQILRPLLNFSKKDILSFNKKNKINFVLDPSNQNIKYSRVIIRNFLTNNLSCKKIVNKDFKTIKKNYPLYKKMVYQILNSLIVNIDSKGVSFSAQKFIIHDMEIQKKIIEIIYKYILPKRGHLRYHKITSFLEKMVNKKNIETNLAGMIIKKDNFYINFTR